MRSGTGGTASQVTGILIGVRAPAPRLAAGAPPLRPRRLGRLEPVRRRLQRACPQPVVDLAAGDRARARPGRRSTSVERCLATAWRVIGSSAVSAGTDVEPSRISVLEHQPARGVGERAEDESELVGHAQTSSTQARRRARSGSIAGWLSVTITRVPSGTANVDLDVRAGSLSLSLPPPPADVAAAARSPRPTISRLGSGSSQRSRPSSVETASQTSSSGAPPTSTLASCPARATSRLTTKWLLLWRDNQPVVERIPPCH